MTYKEAVELAKKKDQKGIAFLYENTYKEKYYVALKYMKNEDDAMDILQDAYMKAFDKLESLSEPDKFPQWLGMIIANTAKDALKKKRPMLFTDMAKEDDDTSDPIELTIKDEAVANQPELSYTTKETQELVQEMISDLTVEQQMAIIMFHFEGLSLKEIAEAMDCNENTVKSRLNYGRKALKAKGEELQKKGYKLYGMAPLPLLLLLLGNECQAASIPAALAAGGVAGVAGTGSVAGISGVTSTTGAAGTTGEAVKVGFFKTLAGKITAGVAGVAVAGGVVASVVLSGGEYVCTQENIEYADGSKGLHEYEYDEEIKDRLVKEAFYRDFDNNGEMELSYIRTNEYDDEGVMTRTYSKEYYRGSEPLDKPYQYYMDYYKYDEHGNMLERQHFTSDGKEIPGLNVFTYKYNEDGNMIYFYHVVKYPENPSSPDTPETIFMHHREYEYNSEGQNTKIYVFSEDGTVKNYYVYEYNSQGQKTKRYAFSKDGTEKNYYVYEYDRHGNESKVLTYDSKTDELKSVKTNTYKRI